MAASNAGSFAAAVLLRLSLVASLLVAAAAGLFALDLGMPSTMNSVALLARRALSHPLVLVLLALMTFSSLRRILTRLQDRA
jgi:hypothetical protein